MTVPDEVYLVASAGEPATIDCGRQPFFKTQGRVWVPLEVGDTFVAESKSSSIGPKTLRLRVIGRETYHIGSGLKHVHRGWTYTLAKADQELSNDLFFRFFQQVYISVDRPTLLAITKAIEKKYPEGDIAYKLVEKLLPPAFREYIERDLEEAKTA